jgi:streptogramin lyase
MRVSKFVQRSFLLVMALTGMVGWGGGAFTAQAASIPGTASLSGTVESAKPFKAARVYIYNADKRIMYTVFTNAGQFRAVALFPGNYEVNVVGKGLESDVQKLALKSGDSPKLKLSLKDSTRSLLPEAQSIGGGGGGGGRPRVPESADAFVPYDQLFPDEPGRAVLERTCMRCHGENFAPTYPGSKEIWNVRIDHMMGPDVLLGKRPARSYMEGFLQYRDPRFSFSKADRDVLVDYLAKYFGPDSKVRAVKLEKELPWDEAKLGKAEFIEYYMMDDPAGQLSKAPDGKPRTGQDVRFDADGNVWLSDRGIPRRLIKLDPRTGVQKEWITPHPTSDVHEVLIGKDGMIWMPEHAEAEGVRNYLLGFNPKTEKWDFNVDMDPGNMIRSPIKWMQSVAFDSKENLYVAWIMGGAMTKFDRETKKATVYPIPNALTVTYGTIADKNDNIYIAQWSGGNIARFNTHDNSWLQFTPPTYPSQMRRGNVDYDNNYWVPIYAAGKRPGKLSKLNLSTLQWTEYDIPYQRAQPYDIAADPDNNMWAIDCCIGYTSTIWKFDTRNQTFTFYPKPQKGDSPKLQVTRDGSIWYSPRGSDHPGFGVLYPDMDKITSLGAYYVNGPPGYPFKPGQDGQRTSQVSRH